MIAKVRRIDGKGCCTNNNFVVPRFNFVVPRFTMLYLVSQLQAFLRRNGQNKPSRQLLLCYVARGLIGHVYCFDSGRILCVLREKMFPDAIVGRAVGKACLDDGFLLGDLRMPEHIVVGISETQHVDVVVESAILLLEHLRDVGLAIAAHFGHIAQRKMRIQEKLSSDQGQLNTLDDFLAGLVGNISGLSLLPS